MAKFKLLATLGLCGLILASCSEDSSEVAVTEKSAEATSSELASSEVAESKITESEVGKRSNPLALGDSATWNLLYSDVDYEPLEGVITTIMSNVVRGEEAYNQLIAANEFNEPAPEGFEWVIFDMSLTLDQGSEDDPFNTSTILITPIASDGSEVAQPDYATFEDGIQFGWKDLYKGGNDSGKVGLIIPKDDKTLIEITDMNTSIFYTIN